MFDDAIRETVTTMIETTRTQVGPAGAAAPAGILALHDRLAGNRRALVCGSGNITPSQLRDLWERTA